MTRESIKKILAALRFLIVTIVCVPLIIILFDLMCELCKAASMATPPESFGGELDLGATGEYRVYIYGFSFPKPDYENRESKYSNTQAVGDSEIVAFYENISESSRLTLLSLTKFTSGCYFTTVYSNGAENGSMYRTVQSSTAFEGMQRRGNTALEVSNDSEIFSYSYFATNTYIFDSYENAKAYLETGVLNGVMHSPTKEYNGEQLYLESFDMIVHDSNNFDNFYVEFIYKPSQYCLDNIDDCYFNINMEWFFNYNFISGFYDWNPYSDFGQNKDSWTVSLKDNPSSYILRLSDIFTPKFEIYKSMILGDELIIDFDKLDILGVGGSNIAKIDESKLDFNIDLFCNGVYGCNYKAFVDLLDSSQSYTYSSTPDEDGDYQYNDDFKQSEVVNVNVAGASVVQNNNQTVAVPDTITVNINQGNDMPNVTIEDDDMSFSSLVDALKSGFGIIDDVDTDVKGDGFPAMLSYLYNGLPAPFTNLILLGVSSVTAIAILTRLFGRK